MRRSVLLTGFTVLCMGALGALGFILLQDAPAPDEPETYEERFLREVRATMEEEERMTPFVDGGPPPAFSDFFRKNEDLPMAVTVDVFRRLLEQDPPPFVLDAREDEEWNLGRFPGSMHIRYADLRAGAWRELPTDRVVYVLCHSGVRGEMVSRFLRSRGITAQAMMEGASGWVESGGVWEGTIDFYGRYSDARYLQWLTVAQVAQVRTQPDVTLVDVRPPYRIERVPVAGTVSIPLALNPTAQLDRQIAELRPGQTVFTVCEDFHTCFDATILGIRLEGRGFRFGGLVSLNPPSS